MPSSKTMLEGSSVAFVGNNLPRRCGIATFTHDLCEAVALQAGANHARVKHLVRARLEVVSVSHDTAMIANAIKLKIILVFMFVRSVISEIQN